MQQHDGTPEAGERGAGPDRPAAVRLRRVGDDLDTVRAELAPLYEGTTWAADTTNGPFSYRYAAAGDAAMTLRTSAMRGHLVGDIPPGDELVVQWLVAGRGKVDVGGRTHEMVRGVPTLFPADETFVFTYEDYDQRLVHLDRGLVADVAASVGLARAGALRFDHTATVSGEAVAAWRATVQHASSVLSGGAVTPLVWSSVTRDVAGAFLRLYEPVGDPLPDELLHPRNAALRTAVEYVHEHAHLPLTAAQIGASAHLGVRALQQVFRSVLGVTPMTYLRDVRLERVRADLLAAEPDATTVAAVAQRWGFHHAGRFSAAYMERYGEYPRGTLQR